MKSDLRSEAVAARLDVLRRMARPVHVDEARTAPVPSRDLSSEAVADRLATLRALCELADYVHSGRKR